VSRSLPCSTLAPTTFGRNDAIDQSGREPQRPDLVIVCGLPTLRRGLSVRLGRYSASSAVDDEHIIMPILVGRSRGEHSAQRDLHVKHVLIPVWSAKGLGAGRRGEPAAIG
jgi:hypothetical protein